MGEQFFTEDNLPALREWLDYNLDAGCSVDQLTVTLLESGFRAEDVRQFLATQSALWSRRKATGLFDADPLGESGGAAQRLWQRLDVLRSFNELSLGDRTVRILASNPRYGIFFIAGFLADEECRGLIHEAGADLAESRVFDERDGTELLTGSRSSRGAGIARGATDIVRRIESRISRLTSLPVAHGEGLQILQYGIGGEYRPHFDYFDPATVGGARLLAQGSQRLASVIMYLSDCLLYTSDAADE